MGDQCPLGVMNLGVAPYQLVSKTVDWCMARQRQSFFLLVDSTDPYSIALASEAVHYITRAGGVVLGSNSTKPTDNSEAYITMVRIIGELHSCVLLNFLPTSSTVLLLREITKLHLSKSAFPVFSFLLTEDDVRSIALKDISDSYLVSNYFNILPTSSNDQFMKAVERKVCQCCSWFCRLC